jgi:hypothetical protein
MYPTDGDLIDWMYHRHRIFSFTFELYPTGGGTPRHHYPPDEVIGRETRRNRDAVLYLMGKAFCPWSAIGAQAAKANCGPLFDDLEIDRGWRVDPAGTDTATDGRWKRGDPRKSKLQLGSAISGKAVMVTGSAPGRDVDGGSSTARSPWFTMPADGEASLRLRYWVGLSASAGESDGLTVRVVDRDGRTRTTVLEVRGDGSRRTPAWRSLSKRLPRELAGQRLAIELEAADLGPGAVVEAGVDQVRVTAD